MQIAIRQKNFLYFYIFFYILYFYIFIFFYILYFYIFIFFIFYIFIFFLNVLYFYILQAILFYLEHLFITPCNVTTHTSRKSSYDPRFESKSLFKSISTIFDPCFKVICDFVIQFIIPISTTRVLLNSLREHFASRWTKTVKRWLHIFFARFRKIFIFRHGARNVEHAVEQSGWTRARLSRVSMIIKMHRYIRRERSSSRRLVKKKIFISQFISSP